MVCNLRDIGLSQQIDSEQSRERGLFIRGNQTPPTRQWPHQQQKLRINHNKYSQNHRKNRCHTSERFATLATALKNHLTWTKPAEKPRKLTLTLALQSHTHLPSAQPHRRASSPYLWSLPAHDFPHCHRH